MIHSYNACDQYGVVQKYSLEMKAENWESGIRRNWQTWQLQHAKEQQMGYLDPSSPLS